MFNKLMLLIAQCVPILSSLLRLRDLNYKVEALEYSVRYHDDKIHWIEENIKSDLTKIVDKNLFSVDEVLND